MVIYTLFCAIYFANSQSTPLKWTKKFKSVNSKTRRANINFITFGLGESTKFFSFNLKINGNFVLLSNTPNPNPTIKKRGNQENFQSKKWEKRGEKSWEGLEDNYAILIF